MSALNPVTIGLYLAVGGAVGAVYFVLLLRTVRLFSSHAAVSLILPLYFLRIAGAVLAFWLVAQQGAVPLLTALLGFLGARAAVQWRAGSE